MLGNPVPMDGLASLLATIQKLYPQARVTSGYRGPGNPLTRAHPNSLHALGSPEDPGAVDVAPIPGLSFDQYLGSVKGAGVPVKEAFDEQKHPFPWTTGPNWHIGSGESPVQPYYPQRKRTLGDMFPQPDLAAQAPVDLGQQGPAQTLGDLAMPNLPQGDIPKHKGLFPGKDWAAIAGILGDSLRGLSGQEPVYGPAMLQRRRDEQQQGFDREKLAALIAQQRAKAAEPPQWLQDATTFNRLPTDQKQTVLDYRNAMYPVIADFQNPDGSVNRRQVPRQLPPQPGSIDDGYMFLGGDPADPKNWRQQ